jgi:N-acetylglutamate synthase/N-acetylornithine aminotransferase
MTTGSKEGFPMRDVRRRLPRQGLCGGRHPLGIKSRAQKATGVVSARCLRGGGCTRKTRCSAAITVTERTSQTESRGHRRNSGNANTCNFGGGDHRGEM